MFSVILLSEADILFADAKVQNNFFIRKRKTDFLTLKD